MLPRLIPALLSLILVSPGTYAERVVVGLFEWQPLIHTDTSKPGLLAEITIAALRREGYSVVVRSFPFARLVEELKMGNVDLAPGISRTKERERHFDYSVPIYSLDTGFIIRSGRTDGDYQAIDDLRFLTGGVLRGSYWESLLLESEIAYETASSQEKNMKKLMAGRIDFICIPKEIGVHLITRLGGNPDDFQFIYHQTEPLQVAVSKNSDTVDLLRKLDRGLESIRYDHTYYLISGKKKNK